MRFITDNLRVKIKFDNYVEKHKINTFSTERIKLRMKKMKHINLDTIPDECYTEVKGIIDEMNVLFKMKENEVLKEYIKIQQQNSTTREMVEAIKHSQYRKILFALHAKKSYDILIWKLL